MYDLTKVYSGVRSADGSPVIVKVSGRKLRVRLDLFNHSPDGFEWGYGGSGPAQLALAILVDALDDDERAVKLHQEFKWSVVGRFPHEGWKITAEQVLTAVRQIDKKRSEKKSNAEILNTEVRKVSQKGAGDQGD